MKLLYCHVDFYNRAGEPGDFRRLHDIDLNLSSTHVFSYDSKKNALSASPRKTPLPENFWANGEEKTNLYNINVVAGSNGSGKSTIINYLIDLLYYVYLDYGAKKTNIPDSARFDVSPNHNLMVFEEAKKLYVLDLEPSGTRIEPGFLCLFDGKDELSPLPEGIEACAVIHGRRDESPAANAFNKCIKGMKVIYMMNNPTQRDYERNLQRQSGGLRSYFVYDCSLGANLGGGTAQFFPYEVYKQVRYLFDGNQMKIRNNVRKLIGNDPDKNDEFVMPAALRIRPRIDMLNDGAAQKLLPSLKDFDPENAEEKKAFINNTALNELLGALCCRAFAENAAGVFKKDAKTAVADAVKYVGSVTREYGSPFCEQERAIHAAANAAFTPPYIQEDSSSTCIAALPGGRVVGGYDDGTLRVWEAASGRCLRTLNGHSGRVSCAAALPDGRVVSGSHDDTLRVWDAASGKCLKILKGHSDWVNCAAVLPDGRVVSGSDDGTLRVWDAASGRCLQTMEEHSKWVESVAILPDGRLVSCSRDATLRVWDAASGQCLKTLKGHSNRVRCVAVLTDGRVVSGSDDATLRVWDAASGQCLKTLKGHRGIVSCAAVLDDGRVVSGSGDATLRVWDAASGRCLRTLEGRSDTVTCAAVLDDGRVVSGSDDGILRV
ncbi:MAG: WD40 repeat domain-containing protein [Clostridia bacterium]|nr:WD40 repeat domain-containing protein [Clostridia bacterium]